MFLSGVEFCLQANRSSVMPAQAGIHPLPQTWIPFFNGMTNFVRHLDSRPLTRLRTCFRGKDGKEKADFESKVV